MYFLKPISPFIEYAIHKEYISEVLCINKNTPKMNCNGKCHLNKQLIKNSEGEDKNNIPIETNSNDSPLILAQLYDLDFEIHPIIIKKICFYLNNHFSGFHFNIFHPPKI